MAFKIFNSNDTDMTPYNFCPQEPPVHNRSQEELKAKNDSCHEDNFFNSQPPIVVKGPTSSTNVSKQMSKMFKEPKVSKIVSGTDHNDKERRASGDSHSPRFKSRVSPRTLSPSPRHSPNCVASNDDASHEHINHHSNTIFSGFGATPIVDDKHKTKSDFQSQIRSSYDSFYIANEQKSPSPQRSEEKRKQFTQSTGNLIIPQSSPKDNSCSDESKLNCNKSSSSNGFQPNGRRISEGRKDKEASSKWLRKTSGSTESKEAKHVSINTKNSAINISSDSPLSSPEEKKNRPSLSYTSSDELEKKLVRNFGQQIKSDIYVTTGAFQSNPMKDTTLIYGAEADDFNETFMSEWENYNFPNSMYCNVEQVKTSVNNLMRRKFGLGQESSGLEKSGIEVTPRSEDSQKGIIKLIQKDLIRSSSIGKRLLEGMEFIAKHSKSNNNKATFFTESLYKVFKGLILNSSRRGSLSSFLEDQKEVDSRGCIKMEDIDPSYFPEKGELKERKRNLDTRKNELVGNEEGAKKNKHEHHLIKQEIKRIEEELKTIEEDLKKTNKKIEEQIKKTNEHISTVIDKIYCVHKVKDQKYDLMSLYKPNNSVKSEIFNYLNLVNEPSKSFSLELQEKARMIRQSCNKLRNNLWIEHVWQEPLEHEFKGFTPVAQIPLVDIIDCFERHFLAVPIFLNGKKIEFTEDSDMWLTLFSKLSAAYGWETTEKILMQQIEQLKLCSQVEHEVKRKYDEMKSIDINAVSKVKYDEQATEYVRLLDLFKSEMTKLTLPMPMLLMLKLATVNTWYKGFNYWQLRFENKKAEGDEKAPFGIGYSENVKLDLHIDMNNPENNVVEQFKCLNFRNTNNSSQIYARVPVSWKAFVVNESICKFILRPLEIEIYDDVLEPIINQIEAYLVKFNDDKSIDKSKLANGGIIIESNFNKGLQNGIQGLKIVPAKIQQNINNG